MATSSAMRPRAIPSLTASADAGAESRAARQKTVLGRALTHLVLIVAAVMCAAPFFYVIMASLKDQGSLFQYPPVWVQVPPYFGNYERLLFDSGFPRWMFNTLFVATTVTASIAIAAVAILAGRGMSYTIFSPPG